mgnify:FL=1
MKKGGELKNKLLIAVYLLAGYISLNVFAPNALAYFLGICLFIAGIYGLICIGKGKQFIF